MLLFAEQVKEYFLNGNFASSQDFFSWLSGFINLESGLPPSKSWRLDRIEAMAALVGNPQFCAPSIHIAGSKGKGSAAGMIASILEAGGMKAARYMSPHVSDFRERVSLGNSFFDEEVYCAAADELRDLVERGLVQAHISLFDPESDEGEEPTFFDLLTLFFFLCARTGRCDAMVVETGLGGRLDCTNIVNPEVSVITFIELEHTAVLGNTIPAIAGEKAGIIKSGKPVILARQKPEALDVFRRQAKAKNSPLYYLPEFAEIAAVKVHEGGTDFSLVFCGEDGKNAPHFSLLPRELSVPIPGAVQAENAAIAAAAAKAAFPGIAPVAIRRGLAQVKIPARFEKFYAADGGTADGSPNPPPVIIDGAHTPESASLCAETFCSLYGNGGILLFGCAADKNAAAMAEIVQPRFSRIIVTAPGSFKISNPEKTYGAFSSDKTIFIKDTGEAVRYALAANREHRLPLLCMGSFYLASELRGYLLNGG
jgi:dihydrofolate synthase/folylpolyglutamate synthase